MIYKVFNFKSLKIVLAKKADTYFGYSVDTEYPEYSRASIRGSAKEVVELTHYLYYRRLMTAYNCENYEWASMVDYCNDQFEECTRDWVHYVLNRYLYYHLGIQFDYKYVEDAYEDAFGNQLVDYYLVDELTVTPVSYWEPTCRSKNRLTGIF